MDHGKALEVAVGLVRTYLRQANCEHTERAAGARYCPTCGTSLVAPYLP